MVLGRNTLPQEFVDATSPIMLKAPQPEFLYTRLVYMAGLQAELKKFGAESMGLVPGRGPDSQGAPVPDLMDMQLMMNDPIRAAAVVMPVAIDVKGTGHTLKFNRPVLTGGGYTKANRRVGAGIDISTSPIDIGEQQTSITVERIVGPFGPSGSIPQPMALDRLDSQRALHSMGELVALNFQYDRAKYVDSVCANDLFVGANSVRPGDAASDAAAFVANGDGPMDLDTLFRAEEKLDTLNIPRFANGKRMCVLHPRQERQLKQDPNYWKQRQFDVTNNPLNAQYIATIGGIELYRSNTVATDAATVSNVTIYQGTMFGPGAIGWGVAEAPRVAASSADNYGETPRFVWICYEGSVALDNTYIVNIRTN